MTQGIFITATGTDIGKTYISGLLVKKLREQNINCGYFKPVLSGAEELNGELIPGDCKHVLQMAQMDCNPLECASYIFKPAVSPHLASREISLDKITSDYNRHKVKYDFMVVEGAGGITCPLNLENTPLIMADLIKALGLEIIIVADSGLGTINSTVLTVEYAKQRGIGIKGIIMNNFDPQNFMHVDNKLSIEKLTNIKVITTIAKNATDIGEIVL